MIRRLRRWLAVQMFRCACTVDPDCEELIAANVINGQAHLWIGNGMMCVGLALTDEARSAIQRILDAEDWEIEAFSRGRR